MMTPQTLTRIKDDLGYTNIDQFAKSLSWGRNAVGDMLEGRKPIPDGVALAATALWIGHRLNVDILALVSKACDTSSGP